MLLTIDRKAKENLLLFAAMVMYVPIVPGLGETQPWMFVICALFFCVLMLVVGEPIRINAYLISLCVFTALFCLTSIVGQVSIRPSGEFAKLLIVLFMVWTLAGWVGVGTLGFYKFFIALHLCLLAFVLVAGEGPMEALWGRYVAFEGGRGISYLAPEPSYAATYSFFVLLAYTVGYQTRIFTNRTILVLLFVILLSTLSLLGLIYALVAVVVLMRNRGLLAPVLAIVAAFSLLTLLGLATDRVEREITQVLYDLISDQSLQELTLAYPSPSTRFVLNGAALVSGVSSLVGHGFGTFEYRWTEVLRQVGLGEIVHVHEVLHVYAEQDLPLKTQALFPYVVYSFGLFGLLLLAYPIKCITSLLLRREYAFALAGVLILFLFFFYQAQFTNPAQFLVFSLIACQGFNSGAGKSAINN